MSPMFPNQYDYEVGSYGRRQQLRRMGGTALTTSPQMLPLLNAIARMMGSSDFMGMGATEQQLLQTAAGFALDNGLLPGYITNTADTYDDMYQTLFSTGAFRGMPAGDFAETAYAMHSRMNAYIFGADGSVNYMNTGGMSGTLASQVYTKVLGEEIAKGNMSPGTVRTNLTGGRTGGAGVAAMMRNVNGMVRSGEITYAEAQRYRQAERAWSNVGVEAEARVRMLMEANPGMSREEAVRKASNADEVRKARDIVAGREGFDQSKFNEEVAESVRSMNDEDKRRHEELSLRLLDSVDGDGTALDPEGIATDQELIGDRGTGNTLRDARSGRLHIQRVGTTSQVSFKRGEGESLDAYMTRLGRMARDGSLSGDNFNKMSKAVEQWTEANAGGALNGLSGDDLVNKLFEMGYTELADIAKSGDTGVMDQFKTEAEELKKKVEARVRKIGESVKVLEEVFGTDDLNELQRYATELGIGSLTDVGNAERMNKAVSNMYDLANYSGRSIESVMLERKSLAKTMASMSGGKQFVSEDALNYMQLLNQQSLNDDTAGGLYTTEERFALAMRSQENAVKHFGGAGAAKYILQSRPGMLSAEDRKDFADKVAEVERLMQSSDPEDREQAKVLSDELSRRLEDAYNVDPRKMRLYFNRSGYDFVKASARQGAVLQFNQAVEDSVGEGAINAAQASEMSEAFKLRLGLFGSDLSGFNSLVTAVKGKSGTELQSAISKYMEKQGISADSDQGRDLYKLATQLAAMSADGNVAGNQALALLGSHEITQGLVGSVTEAGVRKKAWEAFQKSGMMGSVGSSSSVTDSVLRAYFTGGQESTLSGYLEGTMWETVRKNNAWEKAKDRGVQEEYLKKTMKDGGGAVLSSIGADGKVVVNEDALEALAGAGVKVSDAQKAAFKKLTSNADRYAMLRDVVAGAGGELSMVNNHVVYASEKQIEEASKKAKEISELMSLNAQDVVGSRSDGGRNVTEKELAALGLRDSDFDKEGKYIGDMAVFQGKDKTGVLEMLNKEGENHKTLAEEIAENKDEQNPVNAILKKVTDLCDSVVNIENKVKDRQVEMAQPGSASSQGGRVNN